MVDIPTGLRGFLNGLTSAELRLELADAEQTRPTTIKGVCNKRTRLRVITGLLTERGSF
jgi:hypothetical protein